MTLPPDFTFTSLPDLLTIVDTQALRRLYVPQTGAMISSGLPNGPTRK